MDDTLESVTATSHLERVVARYLAGLAYTPEAATAKAHSLLADIPPDSAPTQALKLIDDRIRHWLAAMVARTGITVHPYSAAPRVALLTLEIGKHWPDQLLQSTPSRAFESAFMQALPLSLPGVLAGVILGFARSIGEFGATITFVSNIPGETQTLPIAIYSALQMPGSEAAVTRLALISVALSLGALVLSELLARRFHEAKGRAHVL